MPLGFCLHRVCVPVHPWQTAPWAKNFKRPRCCTVQAVGVTVVVGYGLTETSPVLTVRNLACNVRGTIGESGGRAAAVEKSENAQIPLTFFCLPASCSNPALICLSLPHCATTVHRLAAHLM